MPGHSCALNFDTMSLSPSKKVEKTLRESSEFDTACNSVYQECLDLTQHKFSGVFPYQLSGASGRLYLTLSSSFRPVQKWVPSPPNQFQIDKALRKLPDSGEETIGPAEFKDFAVELFTDMVVSNAGEAVFRQIPAGIAVIGGSFLVAERVPGIGIAVRSGRNLVGKVMGAYVLAVAGSVYWGLSG